MSAIACGYERSFCGWVCFLTSGYGQSDLGMYDLRLSLQKLSEEAGLGHSLLGSRHVENSIAREPPYLQLGWKAAVVRKATIAIE